MELSQPTFWMAGRLATDCVEISTDPTCLDRPGFWAVVNTFEGQWFCARFASVVDAPLPVAQWQGIDASWSSSQTQSEYQSNVEKIKEKIAAGDIYQVNLCRVLSTKSKQPLQGLANRLQQDNPAPFASYLRLPNLEIASASPELFLKRDGAIIKSTPIKGTSKTDNFGEKDRAENVMIVDLVRNDLARVAKLGTVEVTELLKVYTFPQVHHMISTIQCQLKEGISFTQIIKALFPMGSMTGAPKIMVMQLIEALELYQRGLFSGSIGYISPTGDFDFNVVIRSFFINTLDRSIAIASGGAITIDSDPQQEWEELKLKVKALESLFYKA